MIMSEFKTFKAAVQKQFQRLVDSNNNLYLTDVSKDLIWETYLDSFPEGTNEVYKERRAYDCVACRQFLRPYGNIVAIIDNTLVSIWDIEVQGYYQEVANGLSKMVKEAAVRDIFVSKFAKLGTDFNHQQTETGKVIKWEHFFFKLPSNFVDKSGSSVEALQGKARDVKNVFKRSLDEISLDAIEITLELIQQKSIYRGEEFKANIEKFLRYKKHYIDVPEKEKDNYCWLNSVNASAVSKIRNTAIGTLLTDISEGKELDHAVSAFERIMAPSNYKRPQAILTKKMIEEAQDKIEELGFNNSLGRRYAVTEDITVNNVLFANRDAKKAMNVFEEMQQETTVDPKKFSKVEEVNIEDFIKDILPGTSSIELMLENKHTGNLMSLIAPQDKEAPAMFKWPNNFSWAYNGDIADSMKQRVKSAGGNVDGVLRFSIQWNDGDNNLNDFDAHCLEPNRNLIHYPNKGKIHPSSGMLDVDITRPENIKGPSVENITWTDINKMQEGKYKFLVHNFSHRGGRTGFTAEIEYNGQIYSYAYNKELRSNEKVLVAEIEFSRASGIKFIKSLPSTTASKQIWGVHTNQFQKVSIMLNSPNHWDNKVTGNKHYFFIMEGCQNDGSPRGFFNEFLKDDLLEHKRVFEALGSKMKVESSQRQLSGLGFSSTQRNSVIAKIYGNFTRTIKINF
jgi:hypothetical protein